MRKKRSIKPARLRVLWQHYTDFQQNQLAPSTIQRDYRKIARVIKNLPAYLNTAIEIRDWLLKRYAAESTRRLLMQFSACCKWAIASDLLLENPFEGLPNQFRRKVNHNAYAAFTTLERDCIIQTFDQNLEFYALWVKFLFWTGCRPEEAAGLKWKHIPVTCAQIHFCEAAPVDTKQSQQTKTWKSRLFPCNPRLQELLQTLRPSTPDADTLVFIGKKGGSFEYHNFQTRQWKPTIEALVAAGDVSLYLSQYHCRHTFITLALDHLPVKDVAYLVGNSPDIIYKHYASRSRVIVVPEF